MSDKLRMMKEINTKKSLATISRSKFTLRPSDWAIVPLVILIVYAWSRVFTDPIDFRMGLFDIWYHNIILHPSVAMLAIAVFGSLYIYRDIFRKDVGRYARVIAYLFAVLVAYYLLVQLNAIMASEAGPMCEGLMGAKTNCAEMGQLYAYLYLLNPFSLLLWGVLSTFGTVILILKTRHEFRGRTK